MMLAGKVCWLASDVDMRERDCTSTKSRPRRPRGAGRERRSGPFVGCASTPV
jgi:hypothetical protein